MRMAWYMADAAGFLLMFLVSYLVISSTIGVYTLDSSEKVTFATKVAFGYGGGYLDISDEKILRITGRERGQEEPSHCSV
jgi:hypothetical protein